MLRKRCCTGGPAIVAFRFAKAQHRVLWSLGQRSAPCHIGMTLADEEGLHRMGLAEGLRAAVGVGGARGHSQVAGAVLPLRVLEPGAHRAAAACGAGDQRRLRGRTAIRRKRAGRGGSCELRTLNIGIFGTGLWRRSIPAGFRCRRAILGIIQVQRAVTGRPLILRPSLPVLDSSAASRSTNANGTMRQSIRSRNSEPMAPACDLVRYSGVRRQKMLRLLQRSL